MSEKHPDWVIDASDLGWPANVWPVSFQWISGTAPERTMYRGLKNTRDGDLQYVDYHDSDGRMLRVWND